MPNKKLSGPTPEQAVATFAKRIDWQGDTALLRQALTHTTFFEGQKSQGDSDNQRLEFLGDAVLDMLVGAELFNLFPHWDEGELTKTRAKLVCEETLARLANNLCIGEVLLMGRGALKLKENERPSVLADAYEAVLGAMYIEQGLPFVEKFLLKQMDSLFDELSSGKLLAVDYKTELQQYVQQFSCENVHYSLLREHGPDHDKTFTAAVVYIKEELSRADGHSKKEAEQSAARIAYESREEWQHLLSKS